MKPVYLCDGIRTPIGRYGGALSTVRTDDLAALPIKELIKRNVGVDWARLDDVYLGCANQAGEDNRNVARMSVLLAGLPDIVPGVTLNRLCGSGLDAVGSAARAIASGELEFVIAGGVESMSRAPFVVSKAQTAFDRSATMADTTLGWRFVNPTMQRTYGTDSMAETGENVAAEWNISRADQDAFAFRSQQRAAAARAAGFFAEEILPVILPGRKGSTTVSEDEHPRSDASLETLAGLKPIVRSDGTITAGNASGINDGAAALILASEAAVKEFSLMPRARFLGMATAGVAPRVMGVGPIGAVRKLLAKLGLTIEDFGVIELNEAFASQALAVMRTLGLADDAPHVNTNGGAIALGHPLGMSGARLVLTAVRQMQRCGAQRALATMCIGVGQGIAAAFERV
jgi:3-oxoadipyl-CoA thiolase